MSDSQRSHEIRSQVKDLALELGKAPTYADIESKNISTRHELTKFFGGLSVLLESFGMKPNKKKKIDASIFNKSIDEHLDSYEPKAIAPPRQKLPYPKLASISDIHWPFCNKKVIDKFLDFIALNQPEYIFLNGDAWDMYSHTKFPRSHNVFTPREERASARKMNAEFWVQVRSRCPNAKLYQMMGNHDVRPLKRILEAYPAAEDWIEEALKKDFTFDGVTTIMDAREEFIIGDVAVFHGYRSQLGAHRDYTMFNCINGHTHRGGTVFRKIRNDVLWELNSGFAGDPLAKGLTYTPQKINEWTPGFGWLDIDGPRFIAVP